jgi:hypothetical protein
MIGDVLGFGFFDFLIPLILIVLLFVTATVVAGIFVLRRCRKELRASGRKTTVATAILAVFLFVVGPIGAGWLGTAYSIQRSAAILIEEQGSRIGEAILTRGAHGIAAEFGIVSDDTVIDVAAFRERLRQRRERLAAERAGTHRGPLQRFQDAMGDEYTRALDAALVGVADHITWGTLTKRLPHYVSVKVFEEIAAHLREGARTALILFLLGVGGIEGGALLTINLLCRRKGALSKAA